MSFLLDNKKIELDYMSNINSNITCIIEEMDLTKLSKPELLAKCEELGYTKCKSKNKGELINLINIKTQPKKKVELIIEEDKKDDELINQPLGKVEPNFVILNNNYYIGDNIELLNKLMDETIDFIYFDPD